MLKAALNGELQNVNFIKDPLFDLSIPTTCPGVPAELLHPQNTWKNKQAYESKARELLQMFEKEKTKF